MDAAPQLFVREFDRVRPAAGGIRLEFEHHQQIESGTAPADVL